MSLQGLFLQNVPKVLEQLSVWQGLLIQHCSPSNPVVEELRKWLDRWTETREDIPSSASILLLQHFCDSSARLESPFSGLQRLSDGVRDCLVSVEVTGDV